MARGPDQATDRRRRAVAAASCLGLALVLGVASVALWVSGLSRAVGAAIVPFSLLLLASAAYIRAAERLPPPWAPVAFVVVVLAAAVYGGYLYVDGLMHPPTTS